MSGRSPAGQAAKYMNTDIRLSTGFWRHPKTKKLIRRTGLEGVRSLQILWAWAANEKPDGHLAGMDSEDIELAADWVGDDGVFFDAAVKLKWIDEVDDGYCLHDWKEHNPWAAAAQNRSDKSRLARMAGTHKQLHDILVENGITGISKEQYEVLKEVDVNDALTVVNELFNETSSPGPKPQAPAPVPAPKASCFSNEKPAGAGPVRGAKKKNGHFSNKLEHSIETIKDHCLQISKMRPEKAFNPWAFVQNWANQRGHPSAICDALSALATRWSDIEDPWPFADAIMKTRNGNYNEADHMRTAKLFKSAWNANPQTKLLVGNFAAGMAVN